MIRSLALILAASAGTAFAQPAPPKKPAPAPATSPPPSPGQPSDDLSKAADAAADMANMPASGDDLAKAADAAAAVAGVGPPAPAAPAAAPDPAGNAAAAPDVDLAALGLDPASAGSSVDDKLNIYGFADFTYSYFHWANKNPFLTDTKSFALGNLNVYLSKNLAPSWRALAEVRFMYVPNGSMNADGTTMVTTATDPGNFSRPIEWGTISIERAYIEYDVVPQLTVRAGHWLTPYGIWNMDHGSPVIAGPFRPYVIGEGLIPEHQTGLDLYGSLPVDAYRIGYHATVSNGRSQTEVTVDTDNKPAFGGRLELEAPLAGTFKIGASAYHGRYTSARISMTAAPEAYDENSVGGDAQWDHGALHIQGEIMYRKKAYLDGGRPLTVFGTPQIDGYDLGYYGLISYRFTSYWNVMPYAFVEQYRPLIPGLIGDVTGYNIGFNFRPTPTVVLKLGGGYAAPIRPSKSPLGDNAVYVFDPQIAWVF